MPVTDFTFTAHALDRMLDMNVQPDEVRKCLEFPRHIQQSNRGDDRSLYYSDRITCVVDNSTLRVVTVVWRTQTQWERDLVGNGEYGDRKYRG